MLLGCFFPPSSSSSSFFFFFFFGLLGFFSSFSLFYTALLNLVAPYICIVVALMIFMRSWNYIIYMTWNVKVLKGKWTSHQPVGVLFCVIIPTLFP